MLVPNGTRAALSAHVNQQRAQLPRLAAGPARRVTPASRATRAAPRRRAASPAGADAAVANATAEALRQLEEFAAQNKAHIAEAEKRLRENPPLSGLAARAAAAAAAAAAAGPAGAKEAPPLPELNAATLGPFLDANPADLSVVDFYTPLCGPCKVILPAVQAMAAELAPRGVRIAKFECNAATKEVAKELGIRAAPTFHLYRGREKVAEMTGANAKKLRELIDSHL